MSRLGGIYHGFLVESKDLLAFIYDFWSCPVICDQSHPRPNFQVSDPSSFSSFAITLHFNDLRNGRVNESEFSDCRGSSP